MVKVDLNIYENGNVHHTDKYELMLNPDSPKLVTRRGQEFSVDLHFNRTFNKDRDGVSFVFSIAGQKIIFQHNSLKQNPQNNVYYGFVSEIRVLTFPDGKPSMSHGTLVIVPLLHRTSDYWNAPPWTAFIGDIDGDRVKVQVRPSPQSDCLV